MSMDGYGWQEDVDPELLALMVSQGSGSGGYAVAADTGAVHQYPAAAAGGPIGLAAGTGDRTVDLTSDTSWLDLDATDAELADLEAAMAEVNAAADDDADYDDGPWHDADDSAVLGQIQSQLDAGYERDRLRSEQDDAEQASRSHRHGTQDAGTRLQRAYQRIPAGTYLDETPGHARAADVLTGLPVATCGSPDLTGRCSSPYHQLGCHMITEHAEATGGPDEARAWNQALNGHAAARGGTAALQTAPDRQDTSHVHQLAQSLGLTGSNSPRAW